MPELQQSTDAELKELLASEVGDRKKDIAAEILRKPSRKPPATSVNSQTRE